MSNGFHHEDDVEAAYDAAEMVLEGFINQGVILLMDERARRQTIGKVGRAIADAVIRSDTDAITGDITDIPGVRVETSSTVLESSP